MLQPSLSLQAGYLFRISCLAIICFACGCSPRVYTSVTESHDPLPADSVILYEKGDPIPASARKIGDVTISDTGPENNKRYRQAIDLAVHATAEAGGNALAISELSETVSQDGTTYALNASMLRIDSLSTARPIDSDCSFRDGHTTSAQTASACETRPYRGFSQPNHLNHLFYVNIGVGFITSDLYASDGSPYDGRTTGITYNAGYDLITNTGFGIGFRYAHFRMNTDLRLDDSFGRMYVCRDCKIGMHYVAPEAGYSFMAGNKIMLSALVGIGYVSYFERKDNIRGSVSGYGTHGVFRATVLISKQVDLGLEIGGYTSRFPSEKLGVEGHDEKTGIKYLNMATGLHIHF